jgi:hypothetical protein
MWIKNFGGVEEEGGRVNRQQTDKLGILIDNRKRNELTQDESGKTSVAVGIPNSDRNGPRLAGLEYLSCSGRTKPWRKMSCTQSSAGSNCRSRHSDC